MNADARPLTVLDLPAMKSAGRRIVMLTCYDAAFARLLDQSGVDVLLVGDSLNQVIAGEETTLSATLDQMIYHAAAVRRGGSRLRHLSPRGFVSRPRAQLRVIASPPAVLP
jgi:3-methyl-2-oxobutanoate hydroxymethyltransferase